MKKDDPFEHQLQQWAREVPRRDPTPEWRDSILSGTSASISSSSSSPIEPKPRTAPRALALAWAAMWLLALGLRFGTPDNPIPAGPMLAPVANLTTDQLIAALLP